MAAGIADIEQMAMTQPQDLALLVVNTIELPNTTSVAELLVNCQYEETL
jgi:hypothetical protein